MSGQSSRSDANNSKMSLEHAIHGQSSWGCSCNCGRSTIKLKSWTDENPGRRFYKCDIHGFVSWVDAEKQCSWQKLSLLEARDEIRNYKQELKLLKHSVIVIENQKIEEDKKNVEEEKKKLEQEKKNLEDEVKVFKEREKLLSQFIAISWGGFIIAIAIIITILK